MRRAASAHASPTWRILGNPFGHDTEPISLVSILVSFGNGCVTGDRAARMYKSSKARAHTHITVSEQRTNLARISSPVSSTLLSVKLSIMATPNSYFVPGYGISRAVIQNEIRYHCGPDAIVRPYTFQVRTRKDRKPQRPGVNHGSGTRWIPHFNRWTASDKGDCRIAK